jgi:chromosome segregation ATPase
MPADEVKGELEQVENELEMNLATNRNVIEQYQQRQAQVRLLCCRFIDTLFTILPRSNN